MSIGANGSAYVWLAYALYCAGTDRYSTVTRSVRLVCWAGVTLARARAAPVDVLVLERPEDVQADDAVIFDLAARLASAALAWASALPGPLPWRLALVLGPAVGDAGREEEPPENDRELLLGFGEALREEEPPENDRELLLDELDRALELLRWAVTLGSTAKNSKPSTSKSGPGLEIVLIIVFAFLSPNSNKEAPGFSRGVAYFPLP